MNSSFHHLPLADVKPGMVLSDVLLDRQGQVLLPQGAVLTASLIALLPRHGIERLAVLRAITDGDVAPPIDQAAVTSRLAHLFRHADPARAEHSASVALHACLLDYRLEREISV
jgi:hypothetical protein